MSSIDRRHFIGAVAAAGAGLAATAGRPLPLAAQGDGRPRVYRIRRDDAVDNADNINYATVSTMVDRSVQALTGGSGSFAECWKKLFAPDDVVTIKINCLFGPGACTHREVVTAVVSGLVSAGVSEDKITIWDRAPGDLVKCGYELNTGKGVKCLATGWEAQPTKSGSLNGPLATLLTDPQVTALINVPVLKTHSTSGITLAHKNHYGSIKNPGDHHGNNCDPYLTDLNALPCIKDKTRLIIADALRPVGDGGPAANPGATWSYGAILAATDPVALDAVGVRIIDEWRATKGLASIKPQAHFLQTSEKAGLGVADLSKIDLIDL